jgi:prepilin-type N-terminal cleavage/methylation domain-containing protein
MKLPASPRAIDQPAGNRWTTRIIPRFGRERSSSVAVRRNAFSVIELMIAIAVIVILAGVLILGLTKVKRTGQAQDTKVALENLRGMLGEFETATRLSRGPSEGWLWRGGPILTASNFWTNPVPSPTAYALDLDAPGDVRDGADDNARHARYGSRAVLNTTLAMGLIASISSNRTALAGISQEKLFVPQWIGDKSFPGPGNDHVLLTNDEPVNEPVIYVKGNRAVHKGKNYICTENEPGAAPPDTSPQWREDGAVAPMLTDGWGNPIILVPSTGLRVRLLMEKKQNDPNDPRQTRIVTSAGLVDPLDPSVNYGTANYRPPAGAKPFWASAGPDGSFAAGDDNLYSFEN